LRIEISQLIYIIRHNSQTLEKYACFIELFFSQQKTGNEDFYFICDMKEMKY